MRDENEEVVLSEKAYRAIIAETFEKLATETGGIFLGKYQDGKWYILETIDPGPNSTFLPAYFEYDEVYVTHLANKVARFYKNGLDLIGLWHRHPGSFSSFSSTDDDTNIKFAKLGAHGAISALVNLDPDFRLTVYVVTWPPLQYKKVNFAVDWDGTLIPPELTAEKSVEDFMRKNTSKEKRNKEERKSGNKYAPASEGGRGRKGGFPPFPRNLPHAIWKVFKKNMKERVSEFAGDSIRKPVGEISGLVRTFLDNEMGCIEEQREYKFVVSTHGEEIIVSMEYQGEMPYYPRKSYFVFGKDYVYVGMDKVEYAPHFICDYIGRQIQRAKEQLEDKELEDKEQLEDNDVSNSA